MSHSVYVLTCDISRTYLCCNISRHVVFWPDQKINFLHCKTLIGWDLLAFENLIHDFVIHLFYIAYAFCWKKYRV